MNEVQDILMVGTHGLTKYEIESPYKFHRPVPSARGLHPCELYVISKGGIKRFNPVNRNYDVLFEKQSEAEEEFEICVAADIWRIGKFYGDFSYILSALDCGHIIGQILVLAGKANCNARVSYVRNSKDIYSDYFKKHGMVMFASIKIRKQGKFDDAEIKLLPNKTRQICYKDCLSKLNYIDELAGVPDSKTSRDIFINKIEDSDDGLSNKLDDISIGYTLSHRTSSHSHIGLMTFESLDEVKAKLNWISRECSKYIKHAGIEEYAGVYMYYSQMSQDFGRGYYRLSAKNQTWVQVCEADDSESEWYRIIHDSHEFLNVDSIPFVFFISVNIEKIQQEYGDKLVDVVYMLSGELSQIVCLLSTGFGWYCRPIKNIKENEIEKKMELDTSVERITYAMLTGMENITQRTVSLNVFEGNENNE